MSTDGRSHSYEPLSGPYHIRLMSLEPSLYIETPLRISFISGKLQDLQDQYEAISYTWGEPLLVHPIFVDDESSVMVTTTLDQALRYLRLPIQKRLLWADAVSINQQDKDEKATQIPLMIEIFRNARRVQAWVGGGPEERQGMQYLSVLSRYRASTSQNLMHPKAIEILDTPISASYAISRFLGLPWFTRLWIVQEVVANNDVVLICHGLELTWSRLISASAALSEGFDCITIAVGKVKFDALRNIAKLWKRHCLLNSSPKPFLKAWEATEDVNILDAVSKFADYQCSDARDRICALYNMATDIIPVEPSRTSGVLAGSRYDVYMDIDYSLDVLNTYQVFAMACICSGKTSDVLNAVLARQTSRDVKDWPSWVPDWRKAPVAMHVPMFIIDSELALGPDEDSDDENVPTDWDERRYSKVLPIIKRYSAGQQAYIHSLQISQKLNTEVPIMDFMRLLHTLSVRFSPRILLDLLKSLQHVRNYTDEFLKIGHQDGKAEQLRAENYLRSTASFLGGDGLLRADSVPEDLLEAMRSFQDALRDQCFFIASPCDSSKLLAQYVAARSIGFGNAAMQVGDQIWPNQTRELASWLIYGTTFVVLILRQTHNTNAIRANMPVTHRLIGSGCVSSACIDGKIVTTEKPEVHGFYHRTVYLV